MDSLDKQFIYKHDHLKDYSHFIFKCFEINILKQILLTLALNER